MFANSSQSLTSSADKNAIKNMKIPKFTIMPTKNPVGIPYANVVYGYINISIKKDVIFAAATQKKPFATTVK